MSQSDEIQKLVLDFAESVSQQTDAIWKGDAETGNKFADKYISDFRKLRAIGDIGRDGLLQLFSHPRPDVRTAAACFLLKHRTQLALEVLQKEAAGTGLVSFEASECIKRWEEGTWNLDPS